MVSRGPTSENSDKLHLQAKATNSRDVFRSAAASSGSARVPEPAIDSSTHVVSFVT